MHALGLEFGSAAQLSKRPGSVLNCLWGNALKRSPGIIRKSRVSYPGPGFLSSATWPSLPKKHYNGLNQTKPNRYQNNNCFYVGNISKANDTLEIERHSMFNFSFIILRYGFHFRSMISSTKPIHKIPGQFVNKPVIRLFCDRALLSGLYTILWFDENVGRIWNILFVTLATV